MNWKELTTLSELDELEALSNKKAVMFFKHSTRCSISSSALSRLERGWKETYEDQVEVVYLDLIRYRSISNELASRFGVVHQSPQMLVVKNGKCVYNASHMAVNWRGYFSE